jgi:anti-anti-sigma factor
MRSAGSKPWLAKTRIGDHGMRYEEIPTGTSRVSRHLTATVEWSADVIRIALAGEMELTAEAEMAILVDAVVTTSGATALHVDATRITFFGSSGLRSLILARQSALDQGLRFTVDVPASGPVARVVDLFELRPWLVDGRSDDPSMVSTGAVGGG